MASSWVISFLLRFPHYQHSFTFVDESLWAVTSQVLASGGRLYQDVWCNNQPAFPIFLALVFHGLGVHHWVVHIASLFLIFLTSTLLYWLGSAHFSPRIGGLAAVIFAVASATYYAPRIIGLASEQLMIVFSTAAMCCFLAGVKRSWSLGLFAAGFFAGLAFLTKPFAFTEIGLYAFVLIFFSASAIASRLKHTLILGLGYGAALLLLLVYLWGNDTFDLWKTMTLGFSFHYVGQVSLSDFSGKLAHVPFSFGLIYAWLWTLIALGIAKNPKGPSFRAIHFWLLAAFLGVAFGRRFYANYYIQMLPAMSIVGATGFAHLLDNVRRYRARVYLAGFALLLPFVFFHTRTMAHWYFLFNQEAHEKVQVWRMCTEERKLDRLAAHVIALSKPSDPIFVWGARPELYFLTRRPLATKYFVYDINSEIPEAASTRLDALEALERRKPPLIVDTGAAFAMETLPRWREFLSRYYVLDSRIGDVRFYRLARGNGTLSLGQAP
ncbi:MAG: ArnT family glycosyltransferase [Acidobacteriota bacterium]